MAPVVASEVTSGSTPARTGRSEHPVRRSRSSRVNLDVEIVVDPLLYADAAVPLLTDQPDLAKAEPKTLRYRLLHIAARVTKGQRKVFLRLAEHWTWALALAKAFTCLRQISLPA